MKILPLFVIVLISLALPVFAQEEGTPVPEKAQSVPQSRIDLAGQMHDIWPIRTRIESAIDSVSQNFPDERRAEIKAAMRKAINYDQIQEASIRAMATTFTDDELKAMIEFYGSDVGRSISAKTPEYENALTPIMVQMLDKAMLDLRTGETQ